MTFIGVTRGFEDEEGRQVYIEVSTYRGIKNPLPVKLRRRGFNAAPPGSLPTRRA
jgi:hypothetical protein